MTNNNRVYYGEYTLEYWVKLILSQKIVLPDYQRAFVWSPEKIKNLIDSIAKGEFIPPIIIGNVKDNVKNKDVILDGQQRLTTLLFVSIGKYLDVAKFDKPSVKLTMGDDIDDDDDNKAANWTFQDIIVDNKIDVNKLNRTYFIDLMTLESERRDFLKNNYLGFCYIVPDVSLDTSRQFNYFSKIFRSLNTSAEPLTRLEARRSLYFLKENLSLFFDPIFIGKFTISSTGKSNKQLDFVKYLSICSLYKKTGDIKKFGTRFDAVEKFYERYIYEVANERDGASGDFDLYNYVDRIERINEAISKIRFPEVFETTIQADAYFFGLVYHIIFCNKIIILKKGNKLRGLLDSYIKEAQGDSDHLRNPARKSFVLDRLQKSIKIYQRYAQDDTIAIEDTVAESILLQ